MNQNRLADCIQHLGEDEFFPCLFAALNDLVHIDLPLAWLFQPDDLPTALYHNLNKGEEPAHIDPYRAGGYKNDPVYQTSQEPQHKSVYRLTEISQNNLSQNEYLRSYFTELAVHDEVGYVIDIPDGGCINISLSRRYDPRAFTRQDVNYFQRTEQVVRQLVLKHWQLTHKEIKNATESHDNIQQALKVFGSSVLTTREQEVLLQLLRGHSNRSAADKLFVSLETLRRHRKHIYQKLVISSQAELFSLFIHSLSYVGKNPDEDPLLQYHSRINEG